MTDSDSTTSDTKTITYLELLEGMNTISDFISDWNECHFVIAEASNISEIEIIFDDIAANIGKILDRKSFEIKGMFLISLLNTTIRFSAIDESGLITSQKPFQSMFQEIIEQISDIPEEQVTKPALADDMLDSLLLNLIKNDFIDICFTRIFPNEKGTITGNMISESQTTCCTIP
jgi:hypothetical protein